MILKIHFLFEKNVSSNKFAGGGFVLRFRDANDLGPKNGVITSEKTFCTNIIIVLFLYYGFNIWWQIVSGPKSGFLNFHKTNSNKFTIHTSMTVILGYILHTYILYTSIYPVYIRILM